MTKSSSAMSNGDAAQTGWPTAEMAAGKVYAVRTTRIYCRPGCASRRPRPENVTWYASPVAAEAAGYRPCKRCRPNTDT
ncbi:Ada metal-binding domain-containing protein, partial [Acinetobacter baumannii]